MFADVLQFPEQASTFAEKVDHLFLFLLSITGSVALLVTVLLLGFSWRYRRTRVGEGTPYIKGSIPLELFWTLTPLLIFIGMFAWGANVYSTLLHPPPDCTEIYVVGRQWMWKIQHPGGQREINELHVPVNQPVRLALTSEDVIHDFFIPAFRTHVDVLPGRYVYTWFLPTRTGSFHLFCSQYCGTGHADMVGSVIVQEQAEYEAWLNGHSEGSLALKGRKLFLKLQCITCHSADAHARAPVLEALHGQTVYLEGRGSVVADEGYLRESILKPRAKIVQGWQPIMPTYQGQVDEEGIIQLIAYIKSLRPGDTPRRTEGFPAPVGAPTEPPKGPEKP
jgi:cytochrome c oxidase subunit 2